MATSRSRGRMSLTTSPPIAISPSLGVLEPGDGAQQRALAAAGRADEHGELAVGDVEVDAAHRRARRRSACADPLIFTSAIVAFLPLPAHRAERQAAHEMPLDEHAEHDRGHQRDDGERARLAILRALEADEGAEHRRQREGVPAGQEQREEELGPAGDEGEDHRGDDAGHGERHGDASRSACQRVQPSTSAASSSERGIWRK